MELTIKELASYLPYGIYIKYSQMDEDGVEGMGCLYQIETGQTDKQLFPINPTLIVGENELYLLEDKIQLVLFPLSCLTKEITIDGDTFVPIEKLWNISIMSCSHYQVIKKHNIDYKDTGFENGLFCEIQYTDGVCVYSFAYSEGRHRFIARNETESRPYATAHQLDLFDKLNEWKIDYRGLIKHNLAISVEELEENPYK